MNTTKYKTLNIILAEDDMDDLDFFTDIVGKNKPGVKIEHVPDGVRLMELLGNILPDILFLDLDMPYKNGLQCLIEIRQNPKLEKLPVVVFSSTTRHANIQTAYEMGAHLFLIKSSDYPEYALSLKAVLELDWNAPEIIKDQYCVNGRYTAFS